MITPEQIKRLIEVAKPEGFSFEENRISYTTEGYCWFTAHLLTCDMWIDVYYPLFLQKCIEGVNKSNICDLKITARDNELLIQHYITNDIVNIYTIKFLHNKTYKPDQAKEQALIYILDNIQKQD